MTDIVRRVLIREEASSADKKTCEIQVLQQKCVSTHVQIRSSCFSESIESIKRFFLKLRLCYSFYYMVICVNYILLEAMRTVEELQKQGQVRAAQSLQGKVDLAFSCCELAPKLLLGLKLEALRSTARVVVAAKVGLPVEVWLRFWALQGLRLLELKHFEQLRPHIQMWRLKNLDTKKLDMIATPYLSEIIPNIEHEKSEELAAVYFCEVFFSDQVMGLMQKDTQWDLVEVCLSYYNGWHFSDMDTETDLREIPDKIVVAHDEVLKYATATLAVCNPEPMKAGPALALEIFKEENRKKLSAHGKEYVQAFLNSRPLMRLLDKYWTVTEQENALVDDFCSKKQALQVASQKPQGVDVSTLQQCTAALQKWRSEGGLREGACKYSRSR